METQLFQDRFGVLSYDDATRVLELRWLERDGPKVRSPVKRGFGIEFIERLVLTDLGGEARFEFEKTGLSCTIFVPAGAISA